ncbi:MAG: hypothetical protein KY395_08055 [Actinobacteria bacterium]|nr:hypothetical protein [Actinomycetota bacterium]
MASCARAACGSRTAPPASKAALANLTLALARELAPEVTVNGITPGVVAWPEGDLAAYLESLRRVLDLGPDVLFPGHGPELTEDAGAVISYYLEHRAWRESQVLAALEEDPQLAARPSDLVAKIYTDVDQVLWPAAELSTRACLVKLAAESVVSGLPFDPASPDGGRGDARHPPG